MRPTTDRDAGCTGSSARWCPVCGDCACGPRYEGDGADGERTLDDAGCPLHGASSPHDRPAFAPLLTREELMALDTESLVEKVLGLRGDITDDAEEIAGLRAALETAARERAEARANEAALRMSQRAYAAAANDAEAERAEAAGLRALHAPLVAAMADYDRATAAHGAHIDAICTIPPRERTREAMEALRLSHSDPLPKMRAAEAVVEAAACALFTAIVGESAGEWLRGRLDYDGTGP